MSAGRPALASDPDGAGFYVVPPRHTRNLGTTLGVKRE